MRKDQVKILTDKCNELKNTLEDLFKEMDRAIDSTRNLEVAGNLAMLMYHHGWYSTVLKWYYPDEIEDYEDAKKDLANHEEDIKEHIEEVNHWLQLNKENKEKWTTNSSHLKY